jgi:hypothetical protein
MQPKRSQASCCQALARSRDFLPASVSLLHGRQGDASCWASSYALCLASSQSYASQPSRTPSLRSTRSATPATSPSVLRLRRSCPASSGASSEHGCSPFRGRCGTTTSGNQCAPDRAVGTAARVEQGCRSQVQTVRVTRHPHRLDGNDASRRWSPARRPALLGWCPLSNALVCCWGERPGIRARRLARSPHVDRLRGGVARPSRLTVTGRSGRLGVDRREPSRRSPRVARGVAEVRRTACDDMDEPARKRLSESHSHGSDVEGSAC